MSYYIFSTLANDQNYTDYNLPESKDVLPSVKSQIRIKGGAGVSNKHFITPQGVMTHVSDEQYVILEQNPVFQMHVKNGHIKVQKRAYEADKIALDMDKNDKSAPLTPVNYAKRMPVMPNSQEEEKPKPVLNKDKKAA